MNRAIMLTSVCLLLSATAFAQKDAKDAKKAAAPTSIACAVEPDHSVDIKKATADKMFADYKGNRYFFCCAGCPGAFKKDSDKYAKNAHIKTPAPAKATKKAKA